VGVVDDRAPDPVGDRLVGTSQRGDPILFGDRERPVDRPEQHGHEALELLVRAADERNGRGDGGLERAKLKRLVHIDDARGRDPARERGDHHSTEGVPDQVGVLQVEERDDGREIIGERLESNGATTQDAPCPRRSTAITSKLRARSATSGPSCGGSR
jgi:hypothetical protein